MKELIIFIHIPKTAGNSFFKNFVRPNIPHHQIYPFRGMRKLIFDKKDTYTFFHGHVPYGSGLFFPSRKVKYITLLRDPIERAVSYYYWIKQRNKKRFKHSYRDYADAVSLSEFCENRKFQNMQTRFMAGLLQDRFYPWIATRFQEKKILRLAVKHLKDHDIYFGLTESFDDSIARFQKKFGWEKNNDAGRMEKGVIRPKVAELDSETMQRIKNANKLDLELYQFARDYFNKQSSF